MKNSLYVGAGLLCLGLILNGVPVNGQTVAVAKPAGVKVVSPDGDLLAVDAKKSDQGTLYGDLYVIARYMGGEIKRVPQVDANGQPVMTVGIWIGDDGNPVMCGAVPCTVPQQAWTTATAVGGEPKLTEKFANYTILDDYDTPVPNPLTGDIYYPAPYTSQCVQPVADLVRWGDIYSKTGLKENRLPLDYIYDATHSTTDCTVTDAIFLDGSTAVPVIWNGVTYYTAISYPDLVQAVSFGRLSLARSPEATHDKALDEAITNINKADRIILDASGRLLLTTRVYDPFLTNPDGTPVELATSPVTKAIDSPRENLAFYIKLMKDGHLITPASDRAPIDMSAQGGSHTTIEDGPSTALRPTINIEKMNDMGLGHLVDAANIVTYYAKYVKDDEGGGEVVVSMSPCTGCEQYTGILELSTADVCKGDDFPANATFLASAADKSGSITMDEVVYLNSILGINKVVGTSADGTINYSKNPVYFNFATNPYVYYREATFAARGQAVKNPDGSVIIPATYDGNVRVILGGETTGVWSEIEKEIYPTIFSSVSYSGTNISGFTKMADDDVHTIGYIHTYQIPGLR